MYRLLRFLAFGCLAISLSSCFDFLEIITITKDGSGSYTTSLDATTLQEQMKLMVAFDSTGEMASGFNHSMDSTYQESIRKYKTVSGITNVVGNTSKENVYSISLDFENIEALNRAIYLDKNVESAKDIYGWKKGNLTRKNNDLNLIDEEDESQAEMMKSMIQENKYTVIINAPGKIKSTGNKGAVISDDKKSVTLVSKLTDLMDMAATLDLDIKY